MTAFELPQCGRCHTTARDAGIRDHVANREREARLDNRPLEGPPFAVEPRCRACREAVRTPRRTS